jgi:biopolymer transport protein ExbB
MSHEKRKLRWTVLCRWLALIGIALAVAFTHFDFQPANAQDPTHPSSAGKGTGDNAPKSKADIEKLATQDLSGVEADKKTSGTAPEADTASVLRDIQWLSPHMWAFYAIWVVSLIAVAFAVERFLGLRRSRIIPADFAAGLRAMTGRKGEFDVRHAQRLCRDYPSSAAYVVKAMLAKAGRPVSEIEQAMKDSLEHEATRQYANVRVQNLAFNVAPMLGLAGTVHGIILCFYTMAHLPLGANKMDRLATGIYAALICTLAGLIVAIPAGVLAYVFDGRILRMFNQVEELARSIVPSLERFEGRSRASIAGDTPSPSAAIIGMPRADDVHADDSPLPAAKPKNLGGRP